MSTVSHEHVSLYPAPPGSQPAVAITIFAKHCPVAIVSRYTVSTSSVCLVFDISLSALQPSFGEAAPCNYTHCTADP